MSDQTATLIILGVAIVLFVSNRLPVSTIALGVAVSLWATDVLTVEQALFGFGTPTIVLIAALFVVAEALDSAGITTWAGQQVMRFSGDSRSRLIVLLAIATALLTAMITPNGSVAALYPMVVVLALRMGFAPSQLLMPVAFFAHAGALLVMTGSPVTLLVNDAITESTGSSLGFFSVALTGVPLLILTIGITLLVGRFLLPTREVGVTSSDLGALPGELKSQYLGGSELVKARAISTSYVVGKTAEQVDLGEDSPVHLIKVQYPDGRLVGERPIEAGDELVLRGSLDDISAISAQIGLEIDRRDDEKPVTAGLISRDFGVMEVVIAPRSESVGQRVYPGMVIADGKIVILAVQRHGVELESYDTTLYAGDSLLLQGRWEHLDEYAARNLVIVIDSPDAIRRQAAPLGEKARSAIIITIGMIVLLTSGLTPAVIACLGAAMAMVLFGVVSIEQAHKSINWNTIILVGAMIPLSTAITQTGLADRIGTSLVEALGGGSPYILIAGVFVVTVILGQMISNTATALIMIPICISVAAEMDVSPITLLM
ncbi:MAG: SLC13 family permease, partial [Thermomicrobiales bacterium]|nr:SLC13 family permease [Thermomicrobiales bacterium]